MSNNGPGLIIQVFNDRVQIVKKKGHRVKMKDTVNLSYKYKLCEILQFFECY